MGDSRAGRASIIRLVGAGLGAAVLAMAGTSAGYLAYADRRDRRRFPPPGRVVDVPGHGRRHLWVRGPADHDGPLIVVVACLGGSVLGWASITERLTPHAQVLLYDRSGLGWSDATRRWATSIDDMVDELAAVLAASEPPGPYLLVGHSIGGIVARQYAARCPGQVAGLVMVDSSHEQMDARLKAADPPPWWRAWQPRWGNSVTQRARLLGLRRLAYDLGLLPSLRKNASKFVPEDYLDAEMSHDLGGNARWGDAAELAGLSNLAATPLRPVRDIALTVITGGPSESPQRQRWYPTWLELQTELVELSMRSNQVMAPNAGHHVHIDEPQLVVDAVLAAHRDAARAGA